jgi:hypothetical protein
LKTAQGEPSPGETTTDMKMRRFFLIALLAAGTATFLLAVLRKRQESPAPILYDRPEGGERQGEYELFIGS